MRGTGQWKIELIFIKRKKEAFVAPNRQNITRNI